MTDIEYSERGKGPALLFVPGSFGTGSGWKPVIERLGDRYRYITTSLLGYGGTTERRPIGNSTTMQQTEILDAVFERIAAPVHVVAHSYGGLSVLAHALNGKYRAESLILVEANPLSILRAAGEESLFAMVGSMTKVFFKEFEAGETDAASHVIDFYGGSGTFETFPPKVRDYVISTTSSNVRDWTSGMSFDPPLPEYGRIVAPTLVIRGARSHPTMLRTAELLAAHIPNANLKTIDGGSHFLPSTHPKNLAELIVAHVGKSDA